MPCAIYRFHSQDHLLWQRCRGVDSDDVIRCRCMYSFNDSEARTSLVTIPFARWRCRRTTRTSRKSFIFCRQRVSTAGWHCPPVTCRLIRSKSATSSCYRWPYGTRLYLISKTNKEFVSKMSPENEVLCRKLKPWLQERTRPTTVQSNSMSRMDTTMK